MDEKIKQKENQSADRVILHCDCNSFFASVETVLCPRYRDVPMAVCGSEENRHGIVLAKNELAKRYGIQTAETVHAAREKCPELVIAKPHHDVYLQFSRRINAIYEQYTDLVEPFSIDESWLDVTASHALFGDGLAIADTLRRRVREEIGVTISVGVSFNKLFAKMGSDYKKPDATTLISRENFRQILYPLPIESMMYIGPRTAVSLHQDQIHTLGDLAGASLPFLKKRLGRMGEMLYVYVHGEDDSPVISHAQQPPAKSVGNGMTFRRDIETAEEIRTAIMALSEEIAARLRAVGQKAGTVSLTIKDTYLQSLSRQRPLPRPTDLARELADGAYRLVQDSWKIGRPIRALTVTAMNLVDAGSGGEQISLFEQAGEARRARNQRLEGTLDEIRTRYGKGVISSGAVLCSDFYQVPRERGKKNNEKEEKNS